MVRRSLSDTLDSTHSNAMINHAAIALLLVLSAAAAQAQPIDYPVVPETGATIEDFVPDGWHLLDSASGDLNKDAMHDIVIVIEADTSVHEIEGSGDEGGDDVASWEGPPRVLAVLFKQKGGYRRSVQSNSFVLRAHEGVNFDPWSHIAVDRGSVVVHFYTGGWWRWAGNYRFRFQNSGWFLIGATNLGYHSGSGEMESYDYNLLTGDVEITTGNVFGKACVACDDCEACEPCDQCGECERCVEVKEEIERRNIGKFPLRRLEEFVPLSWEIVPGQFI